MPRSVTALPPIGGPRTAEAVDSTGLDQRPELSHHAVCGLLHGIAAGAFLHQVFVG